ncbi:MAG: hypothetical protein ACI9EZ_001649, partial [Halobacteriales archaeon]
KENTRDNRQLGNFQCHKITHPRPTGNRVAASVPFY